MEYDIKCDMNKSTEAEKVQSRLKLRHSILELQIVQRNFRRNCIVCELDKR